MGAMITLYNENEPFAAEWLENLAGAGLVAPGRVDRRSIADLAPEDVRDARQFHAFAGIGVWSHALRLAAWPDELPVWTGSCPCQPFSTAGKRDGFDDARHLWPAWFRLIRECRPAVVLGEQVASPDGLAWLDAVSADLEDEGYAVGAADLCAAGVGAPHRRQRLYFVAYADEARCQFEPTAWLHAEGQPGDDAHGRGEPRGVAHAGLPGLEGRGERWDGADEQPPRQGGVARRVGNAGGAGGGRDARAVPRPQGEGPGGGQAARHLADEPEPAGATRGFWGDAEWIPCRDGKWRAVEPGTFPLAARAPGRVGRLRAYGNALCAPVAATFVRAVMQCLV